ncbi:xanthine dehydrogenase family protein molybdopterin-binding subunit [Siccirubricoccus sp. KC 17139]|uniref:Xanthine dehydrogenase family protein molybdopterin-binding subunit n=1 Tax=Siccirubricoccus soli TaxID=2899147 RepID=A0ABT1CZA2_9PROT|nr:xanthine dehydrogenase family protein molybdopterin-binding subunit [Siccirubricoccus soli]MCO6414987.1 xanthine dehydrogenase family protein molybdopterin-binding subunit [Siccirubricoccus soli]MCP2681118.1 xanthine dehydrogenase family protein molybdopterin-binding subunit [Siccirubricoccus soli]
MAKFGLSQPLRRIEDPRLLKGGGRYTDDIAPEGTVRGVVLRSPHAAARILSIDTAPALAIPGVLAVFTAKDWEEQGLGEIPCVIPLKNADGTSRAATPRGALAKDQVRHVGDPVAFVVAETLQAARDGAEAVLVDYDLLPSATDLATAHQPGAPLVWDGIPNNIAFDWETGDKAKADALFAQAAHVTKLRVVNNRVVVASMEVRAATAEYDAAEEKFTLTCGTQGSWLVKDLLAGSVFNLPPEKFRVVTPDVGGGFGMKLYLYAEYALVCMAARALRRPVKWISERTEAFQSDTHGRDNITEAELALDKDGKFLALRTTNYANMGAYLNTFAPMIPTMAGTKVLASVYDFQAIHAHVIGVLTHTVPVDAYRGAGRPESNYVVERVIDAAARELGIDRIELRRRNMVPQNAMPYVSAMGQRYDSGDFATVLDAALQKVDWAGFAARKAASEAQGKRRGIGLAYYLEATGGGPTERAEVRFAADGFAEVLVGTQSTGQGHETAYAMLTSHELGIPIEKIRIVQGDSDQIPTGGGTGGARSLYSEGQAILLTTATVIEKGKQAASEHLEAAVSDIEFTQQGGRFTVVGTDRGVDILELARIQRERASKGEPATLLDAAEVAEIKSHTFPNGCHIAEVEVEPETGLVTVARYVVVDDVGHAINPMIVRGQVHGGVAQGIGQAVLERTAYDPESGQLLTASFQDYALPRAEDLPDIEVEFVSIPCETNPLGVKGAGEAGAVGSPPALMNALVDALSGAHSDRPATPESVWKAIKAAA